MAYIPITRRAFLAIEPVTIAVVLIARPTFDFWQQVAVKYAGRSGAGQHYASPSAALWVFSFGIIYSLLLRSDCDSHLGF